MKKNINDFSSLKKISQEKWQELAKKKIFFGHQSVGNNIVDGIIDIINKFPDIDLNVSETSDPDDFNLPIFAHSIIGKNREPVSKFTDFSNIIKNRVGDKVNIAFFKLCYADFKSDTGVDGIFTVYKEAMDDLIVNFRNTLFIHVTVPLRIYQTGPKAWAKKIIGKPIAGYLDNIRINQFNEMLREEYYKKEPIFDLARIESTYPNGKRNLHRKGGKEFYSLIKDYTYDAGHLNALGRKIVAEQLLIFLLNVI